MKLFEAADQYCKEGNWRTIAILKICLLAIGVVLGMQVPENKRKVLVPVCGGIYVVTLVPILKKYFSILRRY